MRVHIFLFICALSLCNKLLLYEETQNINGTVFKEPPIFCPCPIIPLCSVALIILVDPSHN